MLSKKTVPVLLLSFKFSCYMNTICLCIKMKLKLIQSDSERTWKPSYICKLFEEKNKVLKKQGAAVIKVDEAVKLKPSEIVWHQHCKGVSALKILDNKNKFLITHIEEKNTDTNLKLDLSHSKNYCHSFNKTAKNNVIEAVEEVFREAIKARKQDGVNYVNNSDEIDSKIKEWKHFTTMAGAEENGFKQWSLIKNSV